MTNLLAKTAFFCATLFVAVFGFWTYQNITLSQNRDPVVASTALYQQALVTQATGCVPFSAAKLGQSGSPEVARLAAVFAQQMSESGLGWFQSYDPLVPPQSLSNISSPIIRMWYHHGILTQGQTYVGTPYVNSKFINKLNELHCRPEPTIVLADPYTQKASHSSLPYTPMYQQGGAMTFRWNSYALSDDINVTLLIHNFDSLDETLVVENMPIGLKLYEWVIPRTIAPGKYTATIKCEGSVACRDSTGDVFEIKETPTVACLRAGDVGAIDLSAQRTQVRINAMRANMNSCNPNRPGGLGISCRRYKDQVAKFKIALHSLPESGYYFGQTMIDAPLALGANTKAAIRRFQAYHNTHEPGDVGYGEPDLATRKKIETLTCDQ